MIGANMPTGVTCYCDCHKAWASIIPPRCYCTCRIGSGNLGTLSMSWPPYNDEINSVKRRVEILELKDINHQIKRIAKLEQWIDKHEKDAIKYAEEFTENAEENFDKLVKRLDKLESLIDIEKMKLIIMDGAQLHATILKFEARMKELENSKLLRQPHKCPVCDGKGTISSPEALRFNIIHGNSYDDKFRCHCCDGKGLVWG